LQRLEQGDDPDLALIVVDEADLAGADTFVDTKLACDGSATSNLARSMAGERL
jgi:hypothetical protein